MLTALRRRRDHDDEEGFTLIELMVVVLIIGILLAIAIPTFLGARAKAQNRSAQSTLRNALTAEKTVFVDTQQYTSTVASLTAIEPALTFNVATPVVGEVSVAVTTVGGVTNSDIWLGAASASGTCYYIHDNSASATQYGSSGTCGAPAAGAATNWQPGGFPG